MRAATGRSPAAGTARLRLPHSALLALITAHIVFGVGLLGDSAGFLAVAIRRLASNDEAFRQATREILAMLALYFGIPLSFLSLLTGIALALSTKWGVFRYPWVIAKLALVLSVIVVGATLLSPVVRPGGEPTDVVLVIGGAWDVLALLTATGLAVSKPGRRFEARNAALGPTGASGTL